MKTSRGQMHHKANLSNMWETLTVGKMLMVDFNVSPALLL